MDIAEVLMHLVEDSKMVGLTGPITVEFNTEDYRKIRAFVEQRSVFNRHMPAKSMTIYGVTVKEKEDETIR